MPTPSPEDKYAFPKGGLWGGPFDSVGLDPNVRALLIDERWTQSYDGPPPATRMTYAFPTEATDYTSTGNYPSSVGTPPRDVLTGFGPLTPDQKAAVGTALAMVASFTNLTFVLTSSPTASDAALRIAQTGDSSSWGTYPSLDGRAGGDVWLSNDNGLVPTRYIGTDGFLTITHELGHALGLKHGHQTEVHGALAPDVNDNEFSVMTYASYLGSPPALMPTAAVAGSSPQTYMMYDIAALQALYGANFSKAGTTARYTWDPDTGQQFINDRAAPLTGVTGTNKIFSTIWTQGAISTYDLSNFNQDQADDLRPGHWLSFSSAQLAQLNKDEPAGNFLAKGNIYNALLHDNDMRSLINNLITGAGNDSLYGNDADNILTANAGNDKIVAGAGNDTISGGAGADRITMGTGYDVVRDTLADMNGDAIDSFGVTSSVDVLGIRIADGNITVTPGLTTITAGGSTFTLQGQFSSGGEFMISPRGTGADAHTTVAFVNFLPSLAEGVRVDTNSINGIANQAFLTGDGTVRFTLDVKAAVSEFSNALGYYKVAADGTISGVHILFANSHTAAGATVDLGTPGNGERIGFFLVQDGFHAYGDLADNLSFVMPGTTTAGNINAGPAMLMSASLGALTTAQVFHSFAGLNAGGNTQVLSGVANGGHELQIGFEDLPRATGDNDFQDVVIGIHVVGDGFLFV